LNILRRALIEKIDELDSDRSDWPSRCLFQAYQFCHDKDLSGFIVDEVMKALSQISEIDNSEEQRIMAEVINMVVRVVAS
jgi:hypothetical protein